MAVTDVAQVMPQVQTGAAHHGHRAKVFTRAVRADNFADTLVLKELGHLHVEVGEQLVEWRVRARAFGRGRVGVAEHFAIGRFTFLQGVAQGRVTVEPEKAHRTFAIGQADRAGTEQFLKLQNRTEHAALFHLEQIIEISNGQQAFAAYLIVIDRYRRQVGDTAKIVRRLVTKPH